jgi:uncharacterized protein YbjT (DUF2867 family)
MSLLIIGGTGTLGRQLFCKLLRKVTRYVVVRNLEKLVFLRVGLN